MSLKKCSLKVNKGQLPPRHLRCKVGTGWLCYLEEILVSRVDPGPPSSLLTKIHYQPLRGRQSRRSAALWPAACEFQTSCCTLQFMALTQTSVTSCATSSSCSCFSASRCSPNTRWHTSTTLACMKNMKASCPAKCAYKMFISSSIIYKFINENEALKTSTFVLFAPAALDFCGLHSQKTPDRESFLLPRAFLSFTSNNSSQSVHDEAFSQICTNVWL